jgi:glucoside 3-dehydrogenase (cytochrome c) hitch-hiker subunit
MMSLSLSSWLIPSNLIFILGCKEGEKSNISDNQPNNFKFFDSYQAKVVEELTSLIIPSNDTPGAREAGVVFELDSIVSDRPNLKKLYSFGIQWMDYMAKNLYGKDKFLDLSTGEMMEILDIADPYKSEQSKNVKNIQTLRNFFGTLIQQTKYVFYTSETGWKAVGYHGPPQWGGNPDYDRCNFE